MSEPRKLREENGDANPSASPPVRCAECGGQMQLVAITDGTGRLLYNHPLPYLDSG
ncbi:MAG: hypothetical protein H8E66_03990 [Planctomycetes bacterium]|nr:hypothetical protein [Planctomycetota bacterium]